MTGSLVQGGRPDRSRHATLSAVAWSLFAFCNRALFFVRGRPERIRALGLPGLSRALCLQPRRQPEVEDGAIRTSVRVGDVGPSRRQELLRVRHPEARKILG